MPRYATYLNECDLCYWTSIFYCILKASQARVASMYDEELDLQQPLFAVHGYDEKQVKCAHMYIACNNYCCEIMYMKLIIYVWTTAMKLNEEMIYIVTYTISNRRKFRTLTGDVVCMSFYACYIKSIMPQIKSVWNKLKSDKSVHRMRHSPFSRDKAHSGLVRFFMTCIWLGG